MTTPFRLPMRTPRDGGRPRVHFAQSWEYTPPCGRRNPERITTAYDDVTCGHCRRRCALPPLPDESVVPPPPAAARGGLRPNRVTETLSVFAGRAVRARVRHDDGREG